jgi:hypothetical protein
MADEGHKPGNPADDLDLTALNRALQRLYITRALVGSMPPAPATARGRAGGLMVGFVRRALFWLWPQLDLFHAAMIDFAENQFALMEELREHLIDIDRELQQMRQDFTHPEIRATTVDAAVEPAGKLWLELVKCQARIEAVRQGTHLQEALKAPDRLV